MAALLFPELQFSNSSGAPLAGGKVYTYVAGTTTPLETFTASDGLTSVGTYIDLDGNGRPNNGNGIWLGTTSNYKLVIKDSLGSTLQTVDNVSSGGFNGSSSFVTAVSESGLTSGRTLTSGGGLTVVDGGAGSTITVKNLLTPKTATGATYTVIASDHNKYLTVGDAGGATITMTAAATLGSGWFCYMVNGDSGLCTITGVGTLYAGELGRIVTDGSSFAMQVFPSYNGVKLTLPASGTCLQQSSSSGTSTFSGTVEISKLKVTSDRFHVAQGTSNFTASRNDLSNAATSKLFTASAAWNLTGIDPGVTISGYANMAWLTNTSAYTITLKHEDAASVAANRFKFSTGADIALLADQTLGVIYDYTASRWRNVI